MKLFLFRLCLAIGGPDCLHPDYLEQRLTRRQIMEWLAYRRIEPFGDERSDLRHANTTFWIRSAMVNDEGRQPSDFQLRFSDPDVTEADEILTDIRGFLMM